MNDFKSKPEALLQQELAAVENVLRSGWYVLGNKVKEFESAWAKRCGVDFSVGVGNGMDAIEIGIRALNIGAGDEVITTPMTAFATVLAIIRAGATPVLADIDPKTALLDPVSVERCISSKTKGILIVHLYGQVYQMDRWLEICDRYKIHLLEDCAQSHLATWNGKIAGNFGDWGAYSFYPTKNLGAVGDAGAIVTNSAETAQKANFLRNYGQTKRYHHPELGLNSRLDELQAALLSVKLNWLEEYTTKRRKIAEAYYQGINNPEIKLLDKPIVPKNHVYHLFVIICEQRDKFSQYLKEHDICSLIHYPITIHHQKHCQDLKRDPQGLKSAEFHADHCLSIPCHPHLNDIQVDRVIEVINGYKP